ncbi:hypothetical protein MTR67_040554 [Solanum verrucosum]|uniref:Uncharacterized protein n=1 Tax=Solanum verrucosum TaxID=315347 RepID=A0AAF0UJT1_SOLVR|nr:hypothetical protein MTR67_040554 [Solanum verrucosum]
MEVEGQELKKRKQLGEDSMHTSRDYWRSRNGPRKFFDRYSVPKGCSSKAKAQWLRDAHKKLKEKEETSVCQRFWMRRGNGEKGERKLQRLQLTTSRELLILTQNLET